MSAQKYVRRCKRSIELCIHGLTWDMFDLYYYYLSELTLLKGKQCHCICSHFSLILEPSSLFFERMCGCVCVFILCTTISIFLNKLLIQWRDGLVLYLFIHTLNAISLNDTYWLAIIYIFVWVKCSCGIFAEFHFCFHLYPFLQ